MSTFSVRNFNLYYGKNHALKDINIDINSKQVTAFIGPSGCGKSTFLRSFNRMNDLIENCKITGDIIFNGYDVYDDRMDVVSLRTQVGMVFQKPNPFPMSIYDNVAYGLRCQGIRNKDVLDRAVETSLRKAALYDEVHDRLHSSALSLSGGQQQRLCIARAIALEPDVILMDEPTSALDPIATAKIEQLIMELKEHYTLIIVTHSMQQARRVSDNIAYFLLGDLIEYGKTEAIFTNPKDSRTRDYISGRFG